MRFCTRILPVFLTATMLSSCATRNTSRDLTEKNRNRNPRSPYILQIQSQIHPGGNLLYYGLAHTVSGDQPQWAQLERLWDEFYPTIAYSEGGVWPLWKSREEAIRRNEEGGLLRFLAHRDSIPIRSLEPARAAEVAELRRDLTVEQIKVFYLLRQMPQYRRTWHEEMPDTFALRLLDRLSAVKGLEGPPRNLAELEESCRRQYPQLDDWRRVPAAWFDPTQSRALTNNVERLSSKFRDRYMADFLAEAINRGERVFAVAGSYHVLMQEEALKKAGK